MQTEIIDWDGERITEPGLYRGIDLERYHHDTDLLAGPSVSKSSIKHIAPPEGSPKKFWQKWAGNPNRKADKPTKALIFGKAVHALLLGDEVFDDKFVVRPDRVGGYEYHARRTEWVQWYAEAEENGLLVITKEQVEQIKRMAEDAAQHPIVMSGGLNGEVEISMFARCPKTGIWLRSRPDVAVTDGIYNDLKSVAKMEDDFIGRQFEEAGYYLQAAMTKRVCDLLQIPFVAFGFIYCLSEDYADTDYRIASAEDIAIGEAVIDYGLHKIRQGLTSGVWEGAAATYNRENFDLKMNDWGRKRIVGTLQKEGFWS